ncbi:MAG TPA: SDR family oxidoreductase [Nocardioides sp.]|nr:SDR family oxidoreductase [Nocardioides sp.]
MDTTNLTDADTRVAVVTGGSGGIGTVVSKRLAADGMAVAVLYAGGSSEAEKVVGSISESGGTAIAVQGDVADADEMAAAFDRVEDEYGGIDVVVHAAGIMLLSPLESLDLDDLDRMHRVNIRGAFVVAQQAARRVRAGGAIISFSSSVTQLRFPTYSAYAASKAAVEALTAVLARELRGRDITCNAVAPGPTATDLFLDGKDPNEIDDLAKAPPLERLGSPDDIAEVVSFLAGPARWVNGQTLYANGGII